MSTFVLVHGGMHGGWCWKRVVDLLRVSGHDVFAPTLTGLGERKHLFGPSVDLETHVADVMGVLAWEDLTNVTLVGHSYGGMVITAVADRAPERLANLVYLDALWPESAERVIDIIGEESARQVLGVMADPTWNPLVDGGVEFARRMGLTDSQDLAWVASKLTPQPPGTQTQPLFLSQTAVHVPALYVACLGTRFIGPELSRSRAEQRATTDRRVGLTTLEAPHDAMVTHPVEVARLLIQSASDADAL